MKQNTLETAQKRKFTSPEIKVIFCRTNSQFLAGSNVSTLEDIEEISNYFDEE